MFFQKKRELNLVPLLLIANLVLILTACASQSGPKSPAVPLNMAPTDAVGLKLTSSQVVSFAKDITPIIQDSCVSCHGGEKTSAGLDLKTYASVMAGSQNGQVIVPGDAAKSFLIQLVQTGKMPKRRAPLTHAQIQLLVDWANSGAKNN